MMNIGILEVVLAILVVGSVIIILERKIVRTIIYLEIFTLLVALVFLFLAAPDVAMAEAVIGSFAVIFFVVVFEKILKPTGFKEIAKKSTSLLRYILPGILIVFLIGLTIWHAPIGESNPYLRDQYIARFADEIGGENAVAAILLGYRMYDTLLEALILLISVIAVIHMSGYEEYEVEATVRCDHIHTHIDKSDIAYSTIRAISPILLVFGGYLILNGHISPGGGFQGGVVIASFFVVRYMIYDIYDIKVRHALVMEKLVFIGITILASAFIFLGLHPSFEPFAIPYIVAMNILIGTKVAFGVLVIFYRYVAFERR